jgi:MFS family permease
MSTTTHSGAVARERHPATVLAVLLMAPFLAQADATIANVATPAIGIDLGASDAAVELVIGGYLVTYAVLLITGARLGQTHGYKRLFIIGVSTFGAASLIAGLAPNATLLIIVPLIVGRNEGWPVWSWVALAASIPAFAVFLATQRAAAASDRNPLVNVAVIARRPVSLGLVALMTAMGTYYALLFTLAQYFQSGLARSALASGLILVPWVAAFGLAGQVARRLPKRLAAHLPLVGCLMLATAYVAISAELFSAQPPDIVLGALLALGGFGLGISFATLLGHLTSAVPTPLRPRRQWRQHDGAADRRCHRRCGLREPLPQRGRRRRRGTRSSRVRRDVPRPRRHRGGRGVRGAPVDPPWRCARNRVRELNPGAAIGGRDGRRLTNSHR